MVKWINDKIGLPSQAQAGVLTILLAGVAAQVGLGLIVAMALVTSGMFLMAYAARDLL
jgi:hypothetical protein